jgi:hypothetical protein
MPGLGITPPTPDRGALAVRGQVNIKSGSNLATVVGLTITPATFASVPANILLGNLTNAVGPVRAWDMFTFAGIGITYAVSDDAGDFPDVLKRTVQSFALAATSHTYSYPTGLNVGDTLLVVLTTGALTTITTPTGWTLVDSQVTSASRTAVYKRSVTGTEGASLPIVLGTASGLIARTWVFDRSDGTVETVSAIFDNPAGTTLDIGAISPSWAVPAATNTFYITVLGLDLESGSTISAFPTSYTGTGQDVIISATASINCRLGYAERAVNGQSENPSAFTYGAARAVGFIIAVKGTAAGRLNWDGLGVRKNSAGSTFTRRRVNLIEGTGITLTVADDAVDGEVDVTITNSASGGTQGWDDVLAIERHSGANDPFVDTGRFMSFSTAVPTQVTGNIRSDDPFHIHVDSTLDIQAHDTIDIHGPDRITIECTGGSPINLLTSSTVNLESTASAVTLNANTTVQVTHGFLRFTENAASTPSMAAGQGLHWVLNTASPGCEPMFTDDGNVDHPLFLAVSENGAAPLGNFSRVNFDDGTKILVTVADLGGRQANVIYSINPGSLALGDLASQAADTFVGRLAGAGSPTAQNLSALASTSIIYDATTHTFQRAAFTTDVTASQNSNALTIANNAVTYAKMQDITATARFLGRITAGAGDTEELTGTQATTLLDSFTSALKGLAPPSGGGTANFLRADGTWVAPPGTGATLGLQFVTFGAEATLTNERVTTASTTIAIDTTVASQIAFTRAALTGDVTAPANSNATTIANDAVTYAKMQNVTATNRFIGRITALAGDPEELTGTQATTLLDSFTSALKGLAPASGGGTANFLRADGTWTAPPGTSTVGHVIQDNTVSRTQRANLNFDSSTSIVLAATDDSVNNQTDITAQRAALTGAVTAALNSNTTAFGAFAANTILANPTAGVAVPSPFAGVAESVIGMTSGNITNITSAVQSILMRAAGSVFWGSCAADQTLRRSGSGDLGFGTLVTNNLGANIVDNTRLAQIATARLKGRTTTLTGNVEDLTLTNSTTATWNVATGGTISVERTALTGDVTAPANSNVTSIATNVVDNTNLSQIATARLKGRTTAATGNVEDLILVNSTTNSWNVATGGSISIERAALTGDITASANSNTTAIAAGVIVNADVNASAAINLSKLNLADSPTWTGTHTFNTNVTTINGGLVVQTGAMSVSSSFTASGTNNFSSGFSAGSPVNLNDDLNANGESFFTGAVQFSGQFATAATGAINNLAIGSVSVLKLTNGGVTLSGVVAQHTNQLLIITNGNTSSTILHESALSTSVNRFACPSTTDRGLSVNAMAFCLFDNAINRWKIAFVS